MQKYYNPVEVGSELNDRIVPDYSSLDSRQMYAMLEDYYLQGGFRVCDTIQGMLPFPSFDDTDIYIPNYRNYITFSRRKIGMIVYTLDDGKFWQLINNPSESFPPYFDREDRTITTDSDWLEVKILNQTFSAITYNSTTGIFTIIFTQDIFSGSTYEEGGAVTTIIISGSTFINNRLSGLTDVNITNVQEGDILIYNSNFWVNSGISFGSNGTSGTDGTSGSSGSSGTDGTSGSSGSSGTDGTSGSSGSSGVDGNFYGTSGSSGSSGTDGTSGSSGTDGTSGSSGSSGTDGTSGSSGTDGTSGSSGTDGTSGSSGSSGVDGNFYGTSGSSGSSGTDGTSGSSGSSGTDGTSGSSGSSGTDGTSGSSGSSGTDGTSGSSGSSGSSGINGEFIGSSGSSGTDGTSGTSGTSGSSGTNGTSGSSGVNGTSGSSGIDGTSGSSGINGTSGSSGINGTSGSSGTDGTSGSSGENNFDVDPEFYYDDTANHLYVENQTIKYSFAYTQPGYGIGKFLVSDAYGNASWSIGSSGSGGISGSDGTSGSSGSSGLNGNPDFSTDPQLYYDDVSNKLYVENLTLFSGFTYPAGDYGTGRVLSSDINGNAFWSTNGIGGTNGTSGSSGINGTSGSSGDSGYWTDPTFYYDDAANILYVEKLILNSGLTMTGDTMVYGNIYATGSITPNYSSDERLKTNIRSFDALDKIIMLNPIKYNWNDKAVELNKFRNIISTQYGLIAQNTEQIIPEIVNVGLENYMSIDYVQLIPILIQSIKELKLEIDNLKQEINKLK